MSKTTAAQTPSGGAPEPGAAGARGLGAWWPRRAVALAGGVLLAGGLGLGFLPLPLAGLGCTSGFVGLDLTETQDADLVQACGEQRAERQEVVAVLALVGAAALAGSIPWARRPETEDGSPAAR